MEFTARASALVEQLRTNTELASTLTTHAMKNGTGDGFTPEFLAVVGTVGSQTVPGMNAAELNNFGEVSRVAAEQVRTGFGINDASAPVLSLLEHLVTLAEDETAARTNAVAMAAVMPLMVEAGAAVTAIVSGLIAPQDPSAVFDRQVALARQSAFAETVEALNGVDADALASLLVLGYTRAQAAMSQEAPGSSAHSVAANLALTWLGYAAVACARQDEHRKPTNTQL